MVIHCYITSALALTRRVFHSFFFNDTATTEIYTLSLHDALPIRPTRTTRSAVTRAATSRSGTWVVTSTTRSEEHTSELQSLRHLVCRLLLEKKNKRPQRQNCTVSLA